MTPDQPISIAVAVIGVVLCLWLPRRYAIVPLALSICLYPCTLNLPPSNLGFSPQRLIALVLLLRCILSSDIRAGFRWRTVDTVASVYFILITTSQLLNQDPGIAINNRIGFFLCAMVPFWCVRFLITDRQSLCALLRAWLWAAVPLVILGMYQMRTGDSPYFRIMPYGVQWLRPPNNPWDMRTFMGTLYYRASAPFQQYIMYGWYFAILIVPVTNLYFEKRRLLPWVLPMLILPIGVVASLSDGPKSFAILGVVLAALFPFRRHWKVGYGLAAAGYIFVLFAANRSPMELVAQYGTNPASSYYRVALQNYTLYGPGLNGHWFWGYGLIPGAYNDLHDLCIHWVWLLVVHGLMGLTSFYALVAVCASSLWRARRNATTLEDQWLLWSLKCTLVATLVGMLLVALFAEIHYIYHMFLAILANADLIVGKGSARMRQVGILAERDGHPVLLRFHLRPDQAIVMVHVAE